MARRAIMDMSLASAIPTFSGNADENIEYFVSQVRDVAVLENWPQNKRILILKLNCRDAAQKFLIECPQAQNAQNFEDLALLLIEKFKKSQSFEEIQLKFNSIKQKPNQSIVNLINDINSHADKYLSKIDMKTQDSNEFIDSIKLNRLLEAVRPEIKIEILKLGPKNFSEACKYAKNVEKALDAHGMMVNNNVGQNFELNSIMQSQLEGNKQIKELKEELEKVKNNSTRPLRQNHRDNIQCHICGKNHITTKCWYFPQGRNFAQTSNHNSGFYHRGENQNSDFYHREENPNSDFQYRGNRGRRNFRGSRDNRRNHPYRRSNNLNF